MTMDRCELVCLLRQSGSSRSFELASTFGRGIKVAASQPKHLASSRRRQLGSRGRKNLRHDRQPDARHGERQQQVEDMVAGGLTSGRSPHGEASHVRATIAIRAMREALWSAA